MKGRVASRQAVEWLHAGARNRRGGYKGMCAKLVRNAYGFAGANSDPVSSADGWAKWCKAHGIKFSKDTKAAPIGAILFWSGNNGYKWGHVAVYAGGGKMLTQDADGIVCVRPVNDPRWASLPFLGWVDDPKVFTTCVGTR